MNCEAFRDLLFDFLDGSLRDRAPFEAHRASCPACAEILRGIGHNEQVLSAARVPRAPADLWAGIAARISGVRAVPFRRTKIAAGFAAAAALLLSVTLLFSGGPPKTRLGNRVVIREAAAAEGRTLGALVPRYEDVDSATALADTMFR